MTTLRKFWIKCSSWEYWPMWILYIPVVLQHGWLSVKTRSLFFFLKVNPGIKKGFILSDPKWESFKLVPSEFLPITILLSKGESVAVKLRLFQKSGLDFPVILKPDVGFRGLQVQKVTDLDMLKRQLESGPDIDMLVQEFVALPAEFGVFYYRIPDRESGCIPSLTCKEFLSVTGNGVHTVAALIAGNDRAFLQFDRLQRKMIRLWNSIPEKGEIVPLEPIGNHNRGTKFLNGNDLIDSELLEVFDRLNDRMPGFNFGRFDIRAASFEHLKAGDFKILEVNGIGAEPTHVYHPGYSLFKAWFDMAKLWRIAAEIAIGHRVNGERFPVYSEAKARYLQYRNYKKHLVY
ncbi:hypothetical protein [Robertkochia solimangrovi]|uniref:hypothetical protein n=1 Tax=Robertkochia solimangrovi TaxID=2213046 RepID=UPI00117ECFDE|nr:hypothetical protein [Robertkochia solimangrovi]TRZ42797.1 hypothetical protein DMZ48_12060 [Robertkochia solimangrovi]